MFMARGLTAAEAHLAYPLVSCRYPTLSLALWTNYVRAAERADAAERLICLIDRRDRRHAIFAYGVDRSQPHARLRVAHIATFQLIGDLIHRALHQTLEQIAAEHGCREVVVETWRGCNDVAVVSASCLTNQARGVLTLDSTIARTGALN
ncbi:MAG TPA: hypothetical protein PKA55_09790 [Rhodoblastus sp.]|nr:hypothetical protein [Rhodoblastus sp.]